MREFISSIGTPEIVAGIMLLALNAYVLTGGADFGGGLWDLLSRGPRRDAQRALIAGSIGPIWEANHVWLIVVVVVLFTGFPAAFAALATILHIPLTLLLVGIVLRGSAFVFRSYGSKGQSQREAWGRVFSIASTVTPILLGVVIGAIASGAVAKAGGGLASPSFREVFVAPWLGPFPFAVGAFALALFGYLAAAYLAVEAKDHALQEDFRDRALWMAGVVFFTAALALALSVKGAPRIAAAVARGPLAVPLHLATAVAAVAAIVCLWRRQYVVARFAAAAQVSCILWGWGLSQYPYIIPSGLSIRNAAAPANTLSLLLIGLAGGAAILIPSLRYLFRTFAGHAADRQESPD